MGFCPIDKNLLDFILFRIKIPEIREDDVGTLYPVGTGGVEIEST